MDSQVKSQITDKVYQATLDDLYELDQGLEVDLYKMNVFNKDIMIAPGKVMTDVKKDVHYCYVYVIKDGKVAAKLGIYETQVKRDEVYDLTDFEGREFLLFDHYYNEPGTLVEYEMKEETDNIFDYLKRFIKPTNNATATIKEQAAMIRKISKKLGEQSEYNGILKLFKMEKPYDEEWLDSFKDKREYWMFILLVLEVVFDIKFIFADGDDSEDELRDKIRSKPNTSTTVINVSLEETPRHITAAVKSAPKYNVESDSESDDEPVGEYKQSMPEPTTESKAEPIKTEPKAEPSKPKAEPKSPRSFSSKGKPPISEAEAKSPRSFSSKGKPPTPEAESKVPRSFSSKAKTPTTEPEPKQPTPEAEPKAPRSFSSKAKTPTTEPEPEAEPKAPRSSSSKAKTAEPSKSELEPIPKTNQPNKKAPELESISKPSQAAEVAPFRKIPGTLKPRVKVRTVPPPPKESPPKNETKNNP